MKKRLLIFTGLLAAVGMGFLIAWQPLVLLLADRKSVV